ncbi:MAG: LysM peptidoglycan-binding domain-containing protein, partial [Anaerolineae bacterium]|nr:LysM peptidoglycan-binding domain-containing protein [Anaerolineae bacterium]
MARMKRWTLLVGVLFLLFPAFSVNAQAGDLLTRINSLRASLGLPGYTLNGVLSAAAQSQAQWMADTGTISHNRPDGSSPRARALAAGYGTADVSENIYGGTLASIDTAWTFWINSDIHYRGLTNSRYADVGIGIAGGSINTFVLVFGNPGGPAPGAPQIASSSGSGPAAPPSYIVGQDNFGNIMHEVQPGDTLGDIALIYGYTWDDLDYMRHLNNLEGNLLEVGSVFLVPPHDGTWTPTPGGEPPATETPEAVQNVEVAQVAT